MRIVTSSFNGAAIPYFFLYHRNCCRLFLYTIFISYQSSVNDYSFQFCLSSTWFSYQLRKSWWVLYMLKTHIDIKFKRCCDTVVCSMIQTVRFLFNIVISLLGIHLTCRTRLILPMLLCHIFLGRTAFIFLTPDTPSSPPVPPDFIHLVRRSHSPY